MTETHISLGDVVDDRDGTSSRAVVVNRPPIPADEWHFPDRGTLASDNPGYPDDDRVIIVLFENQLEWKYPEYTGGRAIPMAQLNRDEVDYYAFPESRLEAADELTPIEISLDQINPSPFHARNFDAAANREYIDDIEARGYPEPLPIVRQCASHYEILNGHKRVWASYVAGLESIRVECVYLDDVPAAKRWAEAHLNSYTPEQQAVALERLRDRIGHRTHEIEQQYLSSDVGNSSQQTRACEGNDG